MFVNICLNHEKRKLKSNHTNYNIDWDVCMHFFQGFECESEISLLQFFNNEPIFSKIFEMFSSADRFRAMPPRSGFLPLVEKSYVYKVHAF